MTIALFPQVAAHFETFGLTESHHLSRLFVFDIFSAFDNHFSVDNDVLDACGTPGSFFNGRIIGDGVGVENYDVGKIARFDFTPLRDSHPARGFAGHLADRRSQAQNAFVPDEPAQYSRKRTIGGRVGKTAGF